MPGCGNPSLSLSRGKCMYFLVQRGGPKGVNGPNLSDPVHQGAMSGEDCWIQLCRTGATIGGEGGVGLLSKPPAVPSGVPLCTWPGVGLWHQGRGCMYGMVGHKKGTKFCWLLPCKRSGNHCLTGKGRICLHCCISNVDFECPGRGRTVSDLAGELNLFSS